VGRTLIPAHTKGKERKTNPLYDRLQSKESEWRRKGRREEAQELKRQMRQIPSLDTNDPNFRRLRYVRYADDFLLGFIGPKEEAEEIKQQLEAYLRDDLKLELSRTKTLITHARTETTKFLGYEVHVNQVDTRRTRTHQKDGKTYKRRSINGRIGLRVPERGVKEKSQAYMQQGKAVHRKELTTMSAYEIVSQYQAEYRGWVEYYRMAYNLSGSLSKLKWIMETSLTKTLATKFKVTVPEIYRRYGATLESCGRDTVNS
jgi:hypothetical protein